MNAFLREHARPLIGSALLHVGIGAAVLASAWFSVAPMLVQPPSIEAYLAPSPRAHPGTAPPVVPQPVPAPEQVPPAPAPEPVPAPAVVPDPVAMARERSAERQQQERAVQLRADAAHKLAVERDARRKAVLDARRDTVAQTAAKKKAAAAEAKVRAAAAQARTHADADARARAQREAELSRQLAEEQSRLGAQDAGLQNRYVADLRAKIERAWNRPPSARQGIRCVVEVTQVPGGTVTDVRVAECNGDAAVVESIKLAVFRASPLPTPPEASLFQRKLHLEFNPDG